MQVFWREGEPEEFPYVWLKDNCQCPACFLSTASSRVARVSNLSLDVRPKDVHVSPRWLSIKQPGVLISIRFFFPIVELRNGGFISD